MKRAIPAVLCGFLAACASAPRHPLPPKSAAGLALTPIDAQAASFELRFKGRGKAAGTATFVRTEAYTHEVNVARGSKPACRLAPEFEGLLTRITAAGTVDLAGNGEDQLFVLNEDGGTGSHDEIMLLIDPRDCGVAGLTITVFHQATHRATPEVGLGRFKDLERRPERNFLNAIKYRYGYVGKDEADRQEKNPDYAYYFWARDNGSLNDGLMKIRRYKGRPASGSSVEMELKDGPLVYTAEFKAGVMAYDALADEHYVLFHPQDMYSWPTLLKRAGPYLLIGTRGEGLAAVNLKDFRLLRWRLAGADSIVKELEVKGSEVLVNGTRALKLPGL